MHRLFVALRPPPGIRAQLGAIMAGVPGARWQHDAQLHLTLRFIGAVERPVAEEIANALAGTVAPIPEVTIDGVGRFERRGRTDTLWAGVAPHEALVALHQKVDHLLVRIGLEPDRRRYLPHITVARLARSAGAAPNVARWSADHAALASAPFALPHLILYESHLASGGADYAPVMRVPLAPAAR